MQTWTPSLTGLVGGRYSIVSKYNKIGNQVQFSLFISMTNTSPVNGDVTFTLPVPIDTDFMNPRFPIGRAMLLDSGTRIVVAGAHIDHTDTSRVRIGQNDISASLVGEGTMSASSPFTWTTNDTIQVNGWYLSED